MVIRNWFVSLLLIFCSSFVWANELVEGSIPNENGDYCVIFPQPSVLPKGGGKVELAVWSSTDDVTYADIHGEAIFLAGCGSSSTDCPGANSKYDTIEKTTSYTLNVLPKEGNEYSCSTVVKVSDEELSEPREDSCSLIAFPVGLVPGGSDKGKVDVNLYLRWEKTEESYRVSSSVISGTDGFRKTSNPPSHSTGTNYYPNVNVTELPVVYTAKVYWENKGETGFEPHNVVSECNAVLEGMLPAKLPVTSQPVQPTKLGYNDGFEAGKQACINNPTVCGISTNTSGLCGIDLSDSVAVFDTFTNMLTIPAIDVSLLNEEGAEYTERFEAQLKVKSPSDLTQFEITNLEPVSSQLPNILPDHPAIGIAEDVIKEYLTLNQQTKAVNILKSLRGVDKLFELLNGLDRHSDNPVKQVLYTLEFFLRHSQFVSWGAGDLIEENTLVRTYEGINNHLSVAVRIAGSTETFRIRVMNERFGWIPDKAIPDVDISIQQIARYQPDTQTYCVTYELQNLSSFDTAHQCPTGSETFQGEYGSWAYGYSFTRSNGIGIPLGLYLVVIRKDGELRKMDTVLIDRDNQIVTMYLN